MKLRELGRNGPQVSAIGLGCMGFSEFYASSAANEAEAIGVIQTALSLGLTFLELPRSRRAESRRANATMKRGCASSTGNAPRSPLITASNLDMRSNYSTG
jgi:predicted aldo/keto reductase-like oxidoreductase